MITWPEPHHEAVGYRADAGRYKGERETQRPGRLAIIFRLYCSRAVYSSAASAQRAFKALL